VEVDGQPFETAREAAIAIYGKKTGGWWFFLADPTSGRTLRAVRREYIEAMASIRTKTIRMTMATMMSYEPYQNSQPRERSRLEK
jgi:hypothetical protein